MQSIEPTLIMEWAQNVPQTDTRPQNSEGESGGGLQLLQTPPGRMSGKTSSVRMPCQPL